MLQTVMLWCTEMTERELAASVVMVGIDGHDLDDAFREAYARSPFAGVILFGRNVQSLEQLRALNDKIRALHDPQPLVAIDQEGGPVARLQRGVEELPPMMALGATGSSELCEQAGEQLAFDLRRVGVTIDFAPVLDLAIDPLNTVIGSRAFGGDPRRVSELATAFIRGMERGGMLAVGKHFPGHGATALDSHLELPVIEATEEVMRERELLPFAVIAARTSLMAAHVLARAFDPKMPASVSPRLLTGLLRDEWHYDGAVFTDCLTMQAIARDYEGGTVGGAAAAISAGADCALISQDVELAERAVDEIVKRVAPQRLREASQRMMRLRMSVQPPIALDAQARYHGIGMEIARRAVTKVRGEAHFERDATVMISVPQDPAPSDTEALLAQISGGRRPIVLMRRAHIYERQAHAIREILDRHPDAVLVSAREPFDIALFPQARTVFAIYGDGEVSLAGLEAVLFGVCEPKGAIPVELSA
jgi:beta-N-acetylhexosaminidase